MNTGEIKNQAVINNAAEQFRSLLETYFIAIARAAEESFMEEKNQTEPKAKASFVLEWDALSLAPKVVVKIGWSVRYKDETESMVDPLQSKLGLVEDAK